MRESWILEAWKSVLYIHNNRLGFFVNTLKWDSADVCASDMSQAFL